MGIYRSRQQRRLCDSEYLVGNNMEGIGCGLIGGTVSAFAWMHLGKPRKINAEGIPSEIGTGVFPYYKSDELPP